MDMKLEVGKYYKNRKGEKVGPMEGDTGLYSFPFMDAKGRTYARNGAYVIGGNYKLDLIEEWKEETESLDLSNPNHTPWRDMTPAEKKELLYAAHEGAVIEVWVVDHDWSGWVRRSFDMWVEGNAYRARPKLKRETVTLYTSKPHGPWGWTADNSAEKRTHAITFDTLNDKPIPGRYVNEAGDVVEIKEL
jgi:hypothetical protein